jgi:hypothetical protein
MFTKMKEKYNLKITKLLILYLKKLKNADFKLIPLIVMWLKKSYFILALPLLRYN